MVSRQRNSLLSIAVLAVCVNGAGVASAQGFAADKTNAVAATVNGEKIPAAEVRKLLKADRPPVHPLTQKQRREMWEFALNMLINDALMRQFLAKNAPPVAPQLIAQEIEALKIALAKKKTTFAKFLADSDLTEAELKADIVSKIQWRTYLQQRLPDQMVKRYYHANKVFFDKVFVRASHILLKVEENTTAAQKQALKLKLQQIRRDILAGKIRFADAAKKYSDCPSKDKGGDLNFFPYKFVVTEPFARVAFSTDVGKISAPVETEFGYHIIKVTDRTQGEPSNFEEKREFVRDVYAQDLQIFQSILEEQRRKAEIQIFAPGL